MLADELVMSLAQLTAGWWFCVTPPKQISAGVAMRRRADRNRPVTGRFPLDASADCCHQKQRIIQLIRCAPVPTLRFSHLQRHGKRNPSGPSFSDDCATQLNS